MDSWVVPLIVGVATSLATVVVGFLTYRQSRRDIRENLKRDVELYKSMPDDWEARRVLSWYIDQRVRELPVSEATSRRAKVVFSIGTIAPGLAFALAISKGRTEFWSFTVRYGLIMLVFYVGILGFTFVFAQIEKRNRSHVTTSLRSWRGTRTRDNRRPPDSSQ